MARELDPQAADLLGALAEMNTPPTYAVAPADSRERIEALFAVDDPEPVGDVAEARLDGPAGHVPVRIYYPDADGPHPVHVYFHGGGWVVGSVDSHDATARAITNGVGCAVVSVDYRLAPEHPVPAAVEDCMAAVDWVAEFGDSIDLDADRLSVGGDSAGGNLAAAVSLLARDRGGPAIAHQSLVYPALAPPGLVDYESYDENAEGYLLELRSMEWYYDQYTPHETDRRNEYAFPILARDLADLPPATVVTAEFDPLRDEGIEYAERLSAAGVPVEHAHFDGMIHGFVSLADELDRGRDGIDAVVSGLREAFE